MVFTIAHTAEDNGEVNCYGTFAKRERAEAERRRMERSLDKDRDAAGGSVGSLTVCCIMPRDTWWAGQVGA